MKLVAVIPMVAVGLSLSCSDIDGTTFRDESNERQRDSGARTTLVPSLAAGSTHTCTLDLTGVKCWSGNRYGQTTVPALNHPAQVTAGNTYTCALDDDGVKFWGNNQKGQV